MEKIYIKILLSLLYCVIKTGYFHRQTTFRQMVEEGTFFVLTNVVEINTSGCEILP